METGKRLIDANAMREDWLKNGENEYVYDTNAVLDSIDAQPTVDAVEVADPKLLKAIKMLIKQYDHSKNSEYVHSPVAHALFHVWRQVDNRR